MLHFIAVHKIAAIVTSLVIAGGVGGAVAKKSSDDAAHAKAQHALVVKHQQEVKAAQDKAAKKAAADKKVAAEKAAEKAAAIVQVTTAWEAVHTDISAIADSNGNWTIDEWTALGGDANTLHSYFTALRPYLTPAQQAVIDHDGLPFCTEMGQGAAAGAAEDYVTGTEHLALAEAHMTPIISLIGNLAGTAALDTNSA